MRVPNFLILYLFALDRQIFVACVSAPELLAGMGPVAMAVEAKSEV